MRRLRPLVLLFALCAIGALGTMAVGAALGMHPSDLVTLAAYLVPALLVTVLAIALANPLLTKASMRARFLVVAVVGTVVALGNLFALAKAMAIGGHDGSVLVTLILYSAAAGVGAAVALSRSSSAGLDRLAATARRLRDGDLDARAGAVGGGPELDELAGTLDDMAAGLRSVQERERRARATRDDLVTAVSHDLRTPLSSLRAMIEAIDEAVVDDPPTLRRYAGEMRKSVGQLSSMVDDLFELVQLDAGAIEAETVRTRVEDVVESALATVHRHADEKGLTLRADLGDAAAAACSPRLERVLQTLLVNAIRHTPADGTVLVDARRSPSGIELAVQDSGEGIGQENLERVFEPFFRADAARSGEGAGLGLALAKRIVEALGGRIEAQSELARGARFAISLPA
jgi:signal transduction histidine kinase